jgi:hypothetical protein
VTTTSRLAARDYTITIPFVTTETVEAIPSTTTFTYTIGTSLATIVYTVPTSIPTNLPQAINDLPGASQLASSNPLYSQLINPSSPLATALAGVSNNVTQAINQTVNSDLDNLAGSLASIIGISDFYSVHILNYCEGKYTPGPIPNATLKKKNIHRTVTNCSKQLGIANFSPSSALSSSLNTSGTGLNLSAISGAGTPTSGSGSSALGGLNGNISGLSGATKTGLAFYIVGIIFNFFTVCAAVWWLAFSPHQTSSTTTNDSDATRPANRDTMTTQPSRKGPYITFILAQIASSMYFSASLTLTLVAVLASKYINEAGAALNLSVDQGNGFIGITWSAWVCSLIASLPPQIYAFKAWRARRREKKEAKKAAAGEKVDGGSSDDEAGRGLWVRDSTRREGLPMSRDEKVET